MLEQLAFLASYSFFGQGSIGSILSYWEQLGVFSYVLPFLLIFALVFATLSNMKLFGDNKGVSAVIALCVSLLSLQFNVVSLFFSEIFPRVGIGLSVILALLILIGLFVDPSQVFTKYFLLGAGIITFLFVLFQSAVPSGWYNFIYYFDSQTFGVILVILLVIIGIAAVMGAKPKGPKFNNFSNILQGPISRN